MTVFGGIGVLLYIMVGIFDHCVHYLRSLTMGVRFGLVVMCGGGVVNIKYVVYF